MMAMFVACQEIVEDKVKSYVEQLTAAIKANDLEKDEKITKESKEWYNGLSKEDQKKADEALEAAGL